MKKIELEPGIVIPTTGGIGNEPVLYLWMGLYGRGHDQAVPEVIVAHKSLGARECSNKYGEYLIMDGNHRAIASTLMRNKVFAYQLEKDEDLEEARVMSEGGIINPFPHKPGGLVEVVNKGISYAQELTLPDFIGERIERRGIELDKLPQYLRDAVAFR